MRHMLIGFMICILLCVPAFGETTVPEGAAAVINGEVLWQEDVDAIANQYMETIGTTGTDTTSAELTAYVQTLALESCIDTMLIRQDMTALGMYNFVDENAFTEAGQLAYTNMLNQYVQTMVVNYGLDAESAQTTAISILDTYGYTVEYFTQYYKEYTAAEKYKAYLMENAPDITDADIEDAYANRVAESESLYANDAAAFETALNNNQEVWYTPQGYRQVLQIFLPADGDTDEEKLSAVADTLTEIETRLASGEAFADLIRAYGQDTTFQDETFFNTGYSVHKKSVMWADAFVAAAFSEEMAAPGDHSKPVCSDTGVHILYYLKDRESGPVQLTDDVKDALYAAIFDERANAAVSTRTNILREEAAILYPTD